MCPSLGIALLIVNKNLEIVSQQKENSKIKTGCFDGDNNAFIYSTSTHIKYMFCGEPGSKTTSGTFKSIDEPVYVSFVSAFLTFVAVHEEHGVRFQPTGRDRAARSQQH